MAMTLAEARLTATQSALHITTTQFSLAKIDRAIRDACDRFLKETRAYTLTTVCALASTDSTLNPVSSIGDFTIPRFIRAEISGSPMKLVPYETVRRRFQGETPVGKPVMIAFERDNLAKFDKQADQQYNISITHWVGEQTWTLGTESPDSVTLRINEEFVGNVVRWGVRAFLLYGAPGHPDAPAAMEKFEQEIERGRRYYAYNTLPAMELPMAAKG